MNKRDFDLSVSSTRFDRNDEKGSAIVIALFVLALLGVFVALAMTRTASEAAAVGNETAEGRTFYAAQGSLETMTRNFNKLFEVKLNPTETDRDAVRNGLVPGLADDFTFVQEVDRVSDSTTKVLNGDTFSGLYAIQDAWRLRTTATDNQGTQVELTRNILNNRIPIFQFGIFYEDDLELYRPPLFSFGGRVHTNRHFFISPGGENVYFDSRVTAVGHIVTESWRNGYSGDNYNGTYIKDASGTFRQLPKNSGSVLNGTPNVLTELSDYPSSRLNPNWNTVKATFDGNLQNDVTELKLPLKVGTEAGDETKLIEMIKRGKEVGKDLASNTAILPSATPVIVPVVAPIAGATPTSLTADNEIMRSERFANKPGIRISLADTKQRLPGCAAAVSTTSCGKNILLGMTNSSLDVNARVVRMRKSASDPSNYDITPLNASRFNPGDVLPSESGVGLWIKVESVGINEATDEIVTQDITEEFLSLGITDLPTKLWRHNTDPSCPSSMPSNSVCFVGASGNIVDNGYPNEPSISLRSTSAQTASTYADSRSIIKLQRYEIPGRTDADYRLSSTQFTGTVGNGLNYRELSHQSMFGESSANRQFYYLVQGSGDDNVAKTIAIKGSSGAATTGRVVPVPIKMFDGREGLYYDNRATTANGDTTNLPVNGIMSMVDIDIANLRRFFRGDYNGLFPVGTTFEQTNGHTLTSNHFSQDAGVIRQNNGWVLYISDRRGDYDFDGEFDMEDVYGPNDGILQNGEDINFDGALNVRYGTEAQRYTVRQSPFDAATRDHKYFRRGVRLVNGSVLPGIYDSTDASKTRGFTVASENGVYVKGNYNATGLSATPPSNANSSYNNYLPFNTQTHIPASIVSDAITILSNAWNDGQSFTTALAPTNPSQSRVASNTTMRFAMISGDTIATSVQTPNQGSTASGERANGGVHNFKRFLEHWSGQRLDYSGSLINLFNSRVNNTPFKCCALVYNPPRRNWVFDSTFLDPGRLPPGTPYFQYVQTTGFFRSND